MVLIERPQGLHIAGPVGPKNGLVYHVGSIWTLTVFRWLLFGPRVRVYLYRGVYMGFRKIRDPKTIGLLLQKHPEIGPPQCMDTPIWDVLKGSSRPAGGRRRSSASWPELLDGSAAPGLHPPTPRKLSHYPSMSYG